MWGNATKRNMLIVRRLFDELWNAQGDLGAADVLLARHHIHHLPDRDLQGPDAVKQFVADLRTTFPDMRTIIDDLFAAGEKVAVRFTISGTHQGAGMGSPTGRQVRSTGIDIFRLDRGKIVERWGETDSLGLLRQLGAMPESD